MQHRSIWRGPEFTNLGPRTLERGDATLSGRAPVRRRCTLVAVVALVLSACASSGTRAPEPFTSSSRPRTIRIMVQNINFSDARLFAIRRGTRMPLGTVGGKQDEDFTLDLRGSVGPRKEWGSDDDSWRVEGAVGFNFTRQISERQSLNGRATFFSVLDDTENYRTRSTLDYALKLDPELNLSLVAGVRHEYQNFVDPGDDRNNTKAFVGLQVDF